jgi:hypothetical protein
MSRKPRMTDVQRATEQRFKRICVAWDAVCAANANALANLDGRPWCGHSEEWKKVFTVIFDAMFDEIPDLRSTDEIREALGWRGWDISLPKH